MVGAFAGAAMLEALGVDLLNLLRAMQGSNVSRSMLEEAELAVLRLHQLYKELPPTELFPHVQQYQHAVTGLLAERKLSTCMRHQRQGITGRPPLCRAC
jgi:hypothetical protein